MVAVYSMKETIADLLVAAHAHREGRSSISLHEGEASVLRQTVTALQAGKSMEIEHPPLEGWVLVLEGELNLRVNSSPDTEEIRLPIHSLIQLPQGSLTLTANVDSGMLLTVAMGDRPR
jgi:quercetin dioxygenase-like cupin family protein